MDDDPEYLCGQISNDWVVTDKLAIGRKVDGGKYVRCSPLVIGNGDFVDVAVEMDIASTRNANGVVANRVHLSMQHVIQLVNAQDVAAVSASEHVYTFLCTNKLKVSADCRGSPRS